MGRLDYMCDCGNIVYDHIGTPPECCGKVMDWTWATLHQDHIGIHPSERAVVWFDPKTGKHATPGRNDVPMPDRYRKWGYERREFTTLRELDTFCKANNIVNQRGSYDSNGKSYDDEA